MSHQPESISLLGAGLAGSLMACYLARRGLRVDVYEKRPDMRRFPLPAGRSINLALSERGLHALDQVGLKGDVLALTLPMRGRMIHTPEGTTALQPYGQRPEEVIRSVSRSGLNILLMDAAEAAGASIHFEQGCAGYDLKTGHLTCSRPDGKTKTFRPDRIIAADGAGSALRSAMLRMPRFNYSQQFLAHGYKELTIPADADGGFRIAADALHIWPRGTYMLIALPNLDGSFTCTLFMPYGGSPGFDSLTSRTAVQAFFEAQFPDAVPLMPTLLDDFFANPTGPLGTIRCAPWHVGDHALLLGDAAHAIVPFYGQGMNCAFEDCVRLNAHLTDADGDWGTAFASYSAQRKPHTDAIADLALDNYLEMRDRVRDPQYVLQRDIALALERRFPDRFIPKYSMVSFHRIPYAEVIRRNAIQTELLRKLMANLDSADDLDWQVAEAFILTHLDPVSEV